jgi:hypothetical protein
MNAQNLKDFIVRPTLEDLNAFIPYSLAGEALVLGTAAQESHLSYLHQIGMKEGGCGIYQMERVTYDSHISWLKQKPDFWRLVQSFQINYLYGYTQMGGNLYYATVMARVHYWRVSEQLPTADDVLGLGRYWKQYYNTLKGGGTVEEFVRNYQLLIAGLK